MNLKELLSQAKAVSRAGRPRGSKDARQVISTRRASKPKCLLGTKLTRNEWEYLECRSNASWMAEFHTQLVYQEEVRKFEEEYRTPKVSSELSDLLAQAKAAVKRGRPRRDAWELASNPELQTGYGLKLLELQEKYPVSRYYWDDGPGDPREIPWGSLEDLDRLVSKLI